MVKQGKYEANVQIGDVSVPELGGFSDAASTHILMDLNVPGASRQEKITEQDPYGEEFEQAWPVTPYTVLARNNSSVAAWVEVSIDGKVVRTVVY